MGGAVQPCRTTYWTSGHDPHCLSLSLQVIYPELVKLSQEMPNIRIVKFNCK